MYIYCSGDLQIYDISYLEECFSYFQAISAIVRAIVWAKVSDILKSKLSVETIY